MVNMKIHIYDTFPDRTDIATTNPMIYRILEVKGYNTILSALHEMFPIMYKKSWFIKHLYDKKLVMYLKIIDK